LSKSKFVKHIACPQCGSSDGNSLFTDGHEHCFVCGYHKNGDTEVKEDNYERTTRVRPIPDSFDALTERGISAKTAKRFNVSRLSDGGHVYPYFDKDGRHCSNKIRPGGPKSFFWEGPQAQSTLFGQNVFPAGSNKSITLVEGECDAMAAYEITGSRYPVVSVHSASAATKNVADNFEYLNSFEKIVICFDRDEAKVNPTTGEIRYPGQEAALAVAAMFPIGKAFILTLRDHKDANDYLLANKGAQYIDEWFKAPQYTPSGLKLGRDMWDEIIKPKNYETCPYPWDGLNAKTYGIRLSELVIVTADTGVGKTSVLKEIEHYLLGNTKKGVGMLHLEEPNADTAMGLMSIAANKPLHLPDVRAQVSDDELRVYYDATVNTDRVVIWDHFGSNSIHEVLAKIRHMHNLGCKYIVLDHLSIVVSDQSGDERKQLDEITTKLKTLCMELNIAVIAVIHQNRQGQIRGTAGVEQLANIVLKLYRDLEEADEWRRNVTKISVQKNRFCGITGPGVYLWYNPVTNRLVELTKDEIARYESGMSQSVTEADFPVA
jgi:twinkle protein